MPTTNQSLLDAYNALFSNTPYGAMLRRRVSMGLQQRQQAASGQMPRGTAGAAEQSPYESPGGPSGPSGPGRGPSPSPLGGPSTGVNTASGSVPGAGTPGARSVSGPTRTPMGSQTTYAPSWDWNSQTARNIQKYTTPAATILTGPIFGPGSQLRWTCDRSIDWGSTGDEVPWIWDASRNVRRIIVQPFVWPESDQHGGGSEQV